MHFSGLSVCIGETGILTAPNLQASFKSSLRDVHLNLGAWPCSAFRKPELLLLSLPKEEKGLPKFTPESGAGPATLTLSPPPGLCPPLIPEAQEAAGLHLRLCTKGSVPRAPEAVGGMALA